MGRSSDVRPRMPRGRTLLSALALWALALAAPAAPFIPRADGEVLAELPPGAVHTPAPMRALARSRLDIALPLAQFYISQSRATGDLRFLGLAEATLAPFEKAAHPNPAVLVLHAIILQSRHAFDPALAELDRALALDPGNAQGWLTRATVLRVLGRYAEATASCGRLPAAVDPALTTICTQSLRGLDGHLLPAYQAIEEVATWSLTAEARAWRASELGEMAERLGDDAAAEGWFREGLALKPGDLYMRNAYADLLLRQRRAAETLILLAGTESMEPMRLRIAIAEKMQGSAELAASREMLAAAFGVEQQRGDAVHRREQARFLLDVEGDPATALEAALENWRVQREPDDLLILLRAAQTAHRPEAAAPALAFIVRHRIEDIRLAPYLGAPATPPAGGDPS